MIKAAVGIRHGTYVVAATALLLVTAVPANAHHPSDRGNKLWSNGATSTYKRDSLVPAWLKTQMTAVLASFTQPPDEPALGSKSSGSFVVTWYRDVDC